VDFVLPGQEIEQLAGTLSKHQAESLTAYGEAILAASLRMNLVSRRSLESLAEHFIDSAALLSVVDPGAGELADLGSGAGFPGIVVSILRPQAHVTLVDSRRSKVVFLKDVQRRVGLSNVSILHERLEDLAGRVEFELATARALGDVETALPWCLRLLSSGGRLVLFKGPGWSEETERARAVAEQYGAEVARTETVELPGLSRATTFVEFHVKHE